MLGLHCGARASHCSGFSCCGTRALGTRASVFVARGLSSCGSQALECRLSSCGARAQLLRSMWDPPGPGLEPVSPALAGGFLATAPPGKPPNLPFKVKHFLENYNNYFLAFLCWYFSIKKYSFISFMNFMAFFFFLIILVKLPVPKFKRNSFNISPLSTLFIYNFLKNILTD